MASIVLKTIAPFLRLIGRNIGRSHVKLTAAKVAAAKHTKVSMDDVCVPTCPMDTIQRLKPFSEIPGPKGLPLIGTTWDYVKKNGYSVNKLFEAMEARTKTYGPIYKENLGLVTSVVISDPVEYEKVMRGEGHCPHRLEMDPIVHYRKKRGEGLGVVNSQGVEWYRHRAVLNKKMMKPKEVLNYLEPMNEVAVDFVSRLHHIRGPDGCVKNIETELFMWAMESIGTVLFEERIGCLREPPPPEAREFIANLSGYFRTLQALLYTLPVYKYFPTKSWREHERYADKVTEIAQQYINKELQRQTEPGEKACTSAFITYLLQQKALTPAEVNGHVTDLLMGAVETVASTLLWTLYCLATNPGPQEKLHAELAKEMGTNKNVHLNDLHYLKACVKEMFRIYPITFATSRIIPEDVEICGYEVPAESHVQANVYAMGRDPAYFPEPLRYLPDRWLRNAEGDDEIGRKRKIIGGLAFGHGVRMCVGRRFAEQELYIVLSQLIQNFHFEYVGETPQPVLNTVMTPDRPLLFTITPRAKTSTQRSGDNV